MIHKDITNVLPSIIKQGLLVAEHLGYIQWDPDQL